LQKKLFASGPLQQALCRRPYPLPSMSNPKCRGLCGLSTADGQTPCGHCGQSHAACIRSVHCGHCGLSTCGPVQAL